MKKIFFLIIVLVAMSTINVNAEEITNNNGIHITNEMYLNLINLGFTETEIQNMTSEEFNANKDLTGQIISQETYSYFSDISLLSAITSTEYKTMTVSIIKMSDDSYRYKVTLKWKQIPKVRSYDIIGIGIKNNVKVDTSSIFFQQNYCISSTNCTSSTSSTVSSSSTGVTSTFQLPTSTVVTLESYLYFSITKNTTSTITKLYAYGDYSHAVKTITLSNAKKHTVGTNGIVIDSSITDYYDEIDCAIATYSTSW